MSGERARLRVENVRLAGELRLERQRVVGLVREIQRLTGMEDDCWFWPVDAVAGPVPSWWIPGCS